MKTYSFLVITISILAMVAGTAVADNSITRASNLINAKAVDSDGQALGTISDLMIAEDNQLSHIVVSKADGSALVALPFAAASPRVNQDQEVVLSLTKKEFDRAPSFASNNWPDLNTKSDVARGYRSNYGDAWQLSDLNYVNGIWTANPYTF